MNRGSKNLVPIAPRPSGAVSLDPRDYQYPHQPAEQTFVWGVPQADVLSQNGMMHMGAYMLPHQNMYSNYSMPSHWIQPTATFQRLPSQGGSWQLLCRNLRRPYGAHFMTSWHIRCSW